MAARAAARAPSCGRRRGGGESVRESACVCETVRVSVRCACLSVQGKCECVRLCEYQIRGWHEGLSM